MPDSLRKALVILNERPVPAPRPRFSRKGHAYNTQKYKDFKNKIKWKIPKWHSDKQIYIKIAFVYALPQSMSNRKKKLLDGKYCEKHADVDNLAKTIEIERAKRLVDFIENTEPNFDTFNSKMSGEFLVNVYTHNELKEKGVSIEIIEETLF